MSEQILWFIFDEEGNRIGQLVNASKEEATKMACIVYGKVPEQIQVVDSGHRKPSCCGKR